jgi:hypothetical protein
MRARTSATGMWRQMVLACAVASGGLAACQGTEDDDHEVARQPISNGNIRDVGPRGMPVILSG